MEQYEKIIELIEKVNLTPDEKKYLNDSIGSDKEIKRLVEVYRNLKSGLSESVHLDLDMISSYILFEKGDETDDKLIPVLANKIKAHLANCLKCREDYEMLETDYSDVNEYLSNTLVNQKSDEQASSQAFFLQRFASYKYAFVAAISVVILYIGAFSISSITTPDYKKDLFAEKSDDFYRTRGRTSLDFQKGLDALDKGDYSIAAEFLNNDIEQHGDESSIFYTHYILGITYLKSAESNFLGIFNNFDKEKVQLSIDNLQSSIEKNNSGMYENLNLDANYYIGRAYLLLDDFVNAKKYLEIVVNKKGSFYNEATSMIESMERN